MIEINVKMWGNLRRFVPRGAGSMVMQVPDDATVNDLSRQLGAEHEVYAVSLNGKVVALSTRLSAGDRIFLFDHLHGG
jgi:sulfur carrier protein ThiS